MHNPSFRGTGNLDRGKLVMIGGIHPGKSNLLDGSPPHGRDESNMD
jgi:hypothetical protein